MAPLSKYNALLPQVLQDVLQVEQEEELQKCKTRLAEAVEQNDHIGIAYCCKIIKRYVAEKYYLSAEDKAWFATMLLPKIVDPNTPWSKASLWANTLSTFIKVKDDLKIKVDWRPLFQLVDRVMFPSCRVLLADPPHHGDGRTLQCLICRVRKFFPPEAVHELCEEVRPMLGPPESILFEGLGYLCMFMPISPEHPLDYIPELMHLWNQAGNKVPYWDYQMYYILHRAASENPKALDWLPYKEQIFANLLRSFDLPVGRGGMPSIYNHTVSKQCAQMFAPSGSQVSRATVLDVAARTIAWLILPEGGPVLEQLTNLMLSIEGFFHPSTDHDRATSLGTFLCALPRHLVYRMKVEAKKGVPESDRIQQCALDELAKLWMPLILTTLNSKQTSMVQYGVDALTEIVLLSPQVTLPIFTERALMILNLSSLPSLKINILTCLPTLIPAILEWDAEGDFMAELLQHLAEALDMNDPLKTICALHVVKSVASFMVLSPEGCNRGSLAYILEEWVIRTIDKGLRLFDNVGNNDGPSQQADGDSRSRSHGIKHYKNVFDRFFSALSPDLLQQCIRAVLKSFATSMHSVPKGMGALARGLALADPEATLKAFMPVIVNNTLQGDSLSEGVTNGELKWNIGVLSLLIDRAGPHLIKYEADLTNILIGLLGSVEKTRVKLGSKLIKKVIRSLTTVYYTDLRGVTPDELASEEFKSGHDRLWGKKYKIEETNVQWHIPSLAEVQMAVRIYNRFMGHNYKTLVYLLDNMEIDEEAIKMDGAVPVGEDRSRINRIRLCLKQIVKITQGSHTLLDPLPDTRKDNATIYRPLARLMVSQLSLDGFDVKTEIQYSRKDICQLVNRIIATHTSHNDVKVVSKCCQILISAIMDVGGRKQTKYSGSLKGLTRFMGASKGIHLGDGAQCRSYHILKAQSVLQYRSSRSNWHCSSDLHSECCDNLLLLACGPYLKVRNKAQVSMTRILRITPYKPRKEALKKVIDGLDQSDDEDAMKGTVDMLNDNYVLNKLVYDSDLSVAFMEKMCKANTFEKDQIQASMIKAVSNFHKAYRYVDIMPDRYATSEEKLAQYARLLESLQAIMNEDLSLYTHIKTAMCLRYMLSHCPRGHPDFKLPTSILQGVLDGVLNPQPMLRRLTSCNIMILLHIFKPKIPRRFIPRESLYPSKSTSLSRDDASKLMQDYKNTPECYAEAAFVDSWTFGFISNPSTVRVIDYSGKETPQGYTDGIAGQFEEFKSMLTKTATPEFMESFLDLRYVDKKEASVHLEGWNCQIFKGMFQILGYPLWECCNKVMTKHMQSAVQASNASASTTEEGKTEAHNEGGHLTVVAEVFAGMMRAARLWTWEETQKGWESVIGIVQAAFDKTSSHGYVAFLLGLAWITENFDPRRSILLKDFLLKLSRNQNCQESGYSITHHERALASISVIANTLSWRDPLFTDAVLDIALEHIDSPYQKIRSRIGTLIWRLHRNCDRWHADAKPSEALLQFAKLSLAKIEGEDAQIGKAATKTFLLVFSNADSAGRTAAMGPYIEYYVAGAIQALNLWYDEQDPDLAVICNTTIMQLAAAQYTREAGVKVLALVASALKPTTPMPDNCKLPLPDTGVEPPADLVHIQCTSWRTSSALLKFLQTFIFLNKEVVLSSVVHKTLISRICVSLLHTRAEVVTEATCTISLLAQLLRDETIAQLTKTFQHWANTVVPKSPQPTDSSLNLRLAGLVGLGAILNAFPHTVPTRTPEILKFMSKFGHSLNGVGPKVKKIFGQWWDCHQDMWEFGHKEKFDEDQLLAITDLVYTPSYFT